MTARWLMVLWLAWGTCAAIDEAAIPREESAHGSP